MDTINAIVDAILAAVFAVFSWAGAAVPLTIVAAAAGAGMLWVFSKTSDQTKVKAVKRRAHASLLELRVFDEPAVVWRAQKALFAANLRYMALSLKPALWMALPMALLLIHLESFYGRAPLPVGREAVVTMGMAGAWNPQSPAPQLSAGTGVAVEGPPVRVADAHEVSWRIRPSSSATLHFLVNGASVDYPLEAGAGLRAISGRSVRSAVEAIWHPGPRVRAPGVEWIEIRYPDAALPVFGLNVNWLVWFFVVSMAAALLLKKRFGVVL